MLAENQSEVLAEVFRDGHFASNHYASLVPSFGYGFTPVADSLSRRVVNLFTDFRYTAQRATDLAVLVERVLKRGSEPNASRPLMRPSRSGA